MHRLEGFRSVVVLRHVMNQLAVELKECAEESVAQSHSASDDRVEDRLHVSLRPADDVQDLAGRRLLLQRLRQAFLELACPGAFGLLRRVGDRPRRFGFCLRGLCTLARRSLLGSHRRDDPTAAEDSLGKGALVGK